MSTAIKQAVAVVSNFMDTEENFKRIDPFTLPGVLYISTDAKNNQYLRIGNGERWSTIPPIASTNNGVLIGTLIYRLSPVVPDKYLPLNGALISRAAYKELFDFVIESNMIVTDEEWLESPSNMGYFSRGDEATTFRLPLVDNIILSALAASEDEDARKPGSYQAGTLIGTDYVYGRGTSTPYMTYFNLALAVKNGLTTDLNLPTSEQYNPNISNVEYAESVNDWLTNDDGGHRDTLIHPTEQEIRDTLHLDTPRVQEKVTSSKSSSIIGGDTIEYVSTLGMTRPETIAYPVFIKYTNH